MLIDPPRSHTTQNTVYVAFHEQLPVWAVIGTKKDIKIHRQASSVHILGPHHGPLASTSQGGPHPFGRARSALGVTSGG